jgi:DNA-binding MarR family transcriptional regulator
MALYDPANYDIRRAVLPLIGKVRGNATDELDRRLEPFGIKAADYVVLVAVANNFDTASAVCLAISHDPGAMTRRIDALERRGLVRRVRSAEDRRAVKLELSPEGRKLYPKILAVGVGIANDYLEGFTKAEVRTLEDMLARILANAEAVNASHEALEGARR